VADSNLEIKVGSITFIGEGDGDWLPTQLDKVLSKIPGLIALATDVSTSGGGGNSANALGIADSHDDLALRIRIP
jgi:hypothetical protein